MSASEVFPPAEHLGRDLRISYRLPEPGRIVQTIPCVPHVLRTDGSVQSEVVATALDEAIGFVAVLAAQPDWGSTAALSFGFTNQPVEPTGELSVDGRVVKAGKRLLFVEGRVLWSDQLVAHAEGQFARVPRAGHNADMEVPAPDPDEVFAMGSADDRLEAAYPDRLGIRRIDPPAGVLELEFVDYTRNSAGILHGGVVGALAVAAAEAAAGAPATHASVQYLSPGRTGPFHTAAVPYPGHDPGVWRTTTVDTADRRTMTNAVVTTTAD